MSLRPGQHASHTAKKQDGSRGAYRDKGDRDSPNTRRKCGCPDEPPLPSSDGADQKAGRIDLDRYGEPKEPGAPTSKRGNGDHRDKQADLTPLVTVDEGPGQRAQGERGRPSTRSAQVRELTRAPMEENRAESCVDPHPDEPCGMLREQ